MEGGIKTMIAIKERSQNFWNKTKLCIFFKVATTRKH